MWSTPRLLARSCLESTDGQMVHQAFIDFLRDQCLDLPEDLRKEVSRLFLTEHLRQPQPLRRVKCLIDRLPIIECEYQLRELPGRTDCSLTVLCLAQLRISGRRFRFCLYGSNAVLFANK